VRRAPAVSEHEHESEPGLPEALPAGEKLLWRGTPDWRLLARRGFHFNKFALYFAVLIVWRAGSVLGDGMGVTAALATLFVTVPLAALALGFIALLAWLVERTTVYTLTDRRVVMRIGVVLTVTFNLPLRRIETVRLHALSGEAGDIALALDREDRIGYAHLWPHARPWHLARAEPMLRALPQARNVAALLADALSKSVAAEAAQPATEPSPVPADAGGVSQAARKRSAQTPDARQAQPKAA
jgi:hypothetical protein